MRDRVMTNEERLIVRKQVVKGSNGRLGPASGGLGRLVGVTGREISEEVPALLQASTTAVQWGSREADELRAYRRRWWIRWVWCMIMRRWGWGWRASLRTAETRAMAAETGTLKAKGTFFARRLVSQVARVTGVSFSPFILWDFFPSTDPESNPSPTPIVNCWHGSSCIPWEVRCRRVISTNSSPLDSPWASWSNPGWVPSGERHSVGRPVHSR